MLHQEYYWLKYLAAYSLFDKSMWTFVGSILILNTYMLDALINGLYNTTTYLIDRVS